MQKTPRKPHSTTKKQTENTAKEKTPIHKTNTSPDNPLIPGEIPLTRTRNKHEVTVAHKQPHTLNPLTKTRRAQKCVYLSTYTIT